MTALQMESFKGINREVKVCQFSGNGALKKLQSHSPIPPMMAVCWFSLRLQDLSFQHCHRAGEKEMEIGQVKNTIKLSVFRKI